MYPCKAHTGFERACKSAGFKRWGGTGVGTVRADSKAQRTLGAPATHALTSTVMTAKAPCALPPTGARRGELSAHDLRELVAKVPKLRPVRYRAWIPLLVGVRFRRVVEERAPPLSELLDRVLDLRRCEGGDARFEPEFLERREDCFWRLTGRDGFEVRPRVHGFEHRPCPVHQEVNVDLAAFREEPFVLRELPSMSPICSPIDERDQ
jgi:hypothetical protein